MNLRSPRASGKGILAGSIISGVFILIAAIVLFFIYRNTLSSEINAYLDAQYRVERDAIEGLPIYDDYATPEKENRLRMHLLPDHLAAVRRAGLEPGRSDEELPDYMNRGRLVDAQGGDDAAYFYYNVKKRYRLLTPDAVRGLGELTARFQSTLGRKKPLPPVKIAISSAVRPQQYQADLMARNVNASLETTHAYGASFDIFYDEYFVVLPAPAPSDRAGFIIESLNRRFGFLLGAALRRQFQAALAETLMQMQDEGALYAIYEKRQRCYHVTILPRPAR
jgi:hypothetical protein